MRTFKAFLFVLCTIIGLAGIIHLLMRLSIGESVALMLVYGVICLVAMALSPHPR